VLLVKVADQSQTDKMANSRKPNFLEVDDSILSNKLMVNGGGTGDDDLFESLMGPGSSKKLLTPIDRKEQSQTKFILPSAGLCIKTKETKLKTKFFLNLCYSEDVPEPEFNLNDKELAEILDGGTDAEVNGVRIPMSIGETHKDKDKSGMECLACDVIINNLFYEQKILKSEMHRTFLITVALEGVEEKHKLSIDKDFSILHNRKSFGRLTPQFVRQKPSIKELGGTTSKSTTSSLIQEIKQDPSSRPSKLVQEVSTDDLKLEHSITQLSEDLARAEVKLPHLRHPGKLSVQLGADRIMVESPNGCLDIFVPLDIHQEEATAEYDPATKLLTIDMPLITKI